MISIVKVKGKRVHFIYSEQGRV